MTLLHRLLPGIALVAATFLLSVGLQALAAWTGPGGAVPPTNDAYAPLNTGPTAQTKTANLNANDFCIPSSGKCLSTVGGVGSGVSQIVAGTNVTISPISGTGAVTINASGGGGLSGGSTNYVPKWTSGTTLSGTSNIYDTGANVGIGTVSPAEKLGVSGNLYVSGLGKFGDLNAVNNGIGLWGTPQGVLVGASNGMMVGIGLSGAGSVGIGVSNGGTPYGAIGWDSASGNFGVYAYGRNLALHTDSGRSVFVDSNFGIGTAYPSQKLEVAGNIKAGRFYMGDNQYGTNVPGIGTDGWNVGVTTNGAFAVTNGGSGYQPVYASDYYIANIGKWASQLGGGGTTPTVTVVGGLMYGYNQTVSCPAGYVMTGCTAGSSGDHGGRIRAATNASCTGEADNGQGVYIFGWCLKQ